MARVGGMREVKVLLAFWRLEFCLWAFEMRWQWLDETVCLAWVRMLRRSPPRHNELLTLCNVRIFGAGAPF